MLDTPLTSRIVFTQFLANVSGSIKCIGTYVINYYCEGKRQNLIFTTDRNCLYHIAEHCPKGLSVQLTRSNQGKQELSTQVQE